MSDSFTFRQHGEDPDETDRWEAGKRHPDDQAEEDPEETRDWEDDK